MTAPTRLSLRHRRLWLAVALLAVWVLQALSLAHGVSHAGRGAPGLTPEAESAWADDAWGHVPGSLACEQLDQWVHGAAPPSGVPTVAESAPAPVLASAPPASASPASLWRRYQARAPPRG